MKARPFFLCLLFVLAGCGSTAQQAAPTPTPKPAAPALEKPTYTVERGTIVQELQLTGRVSAVQQQDLSFAENGFVKTVYVNRTSEITAGQLLAELDLGDLPNQLSQAQLELNQAELGLQRADETRSLAIRRAELDYADAQAQLAALQEPAAAEDRAAAQAAVDQASAALDETHANSSAEKSRAELDLQAASQQLALVQNQVDPIFREWDDMRNDTNNGRWKAVRDSYLAAEAQLREAEAAVTKAQIAFDTARQNEVTAVREAESALTNARAQLAALDKGAKSSDLADARRQIERAALALEEARRESDPELERRRDAAKLDLERIQASIDARRLYAPFHGKIAALETKPGASVEAYQAVIRVLDPSALEVLVDQLSVRDASQVGIGMSAAMVFARYQGSVITGTLERLPSSVTTSASTVNPDTGYHIAFDPSNLDLEIGDLADVTFTLERKENVLWLPPQAIRSFEGRRFVVVRDGDRQRRKDIKVGITTEDRVEILSGLEAGEVAIGQ